MSPNYMDGMYRGNVKQDICIKSQPGDCDVLVSVEHSTLNYKDALVVTGK